MSSHNMYPLFDEEWYLAENPDVAAAGVDPLQHYMIHGWREGRNPHPYFDTSWYLEQNKDVAEAGENPLIHYSMFGWREGRDPHPLFDTSWYLEQYKDVAEAGIDPLFHYLEFGRVEGRVAKPVIHRQTPEPDEITSVEDLCLPLPEDPDISLIIPVFNQISYTLGCLRSITQQKCTYSFEVLVVDDASSDKTADVLPRIVGLRYFRNESNIGFIRSCNRGADLARGKYLLFLNNDTRVLSGWLQRLRDTFNEHSNVGIVGSKLMYPDGRLQEAGGIIGEDASGWNWGRFQDPEHPRYNFVRDVDYVSGASLLIPAKLFFDVGRFSEHLVNSYYEDTWLAFATREAGYRVLYQPKSQVIHYEGVTSGHSEAQGAKRYQVSNKRIFYDRWKERLRTHLPNAIKPELASDRCPKSHILIIDATTPTPDQDSGSIDMFNLIKILQREGHRVHFIPITNFANSGKYTQELQSLGVECIYAPYYRNVRDFLSERGDMFSHAILARLPVAERAINDVRELAPSATVIFYTVDLHGIRESRAAEISGESEKVKLANETLRKEIALIGKSDLTVVLSEYEADYLRRHGHRKIAVIPLIRDYKVPNEIVPFEQRRDVVFIGGFQHLPNVDAARWLIEDIWPNVTRLTFERGLSPIRLKIVGSKMPEWIRTFKSPDIEPIGYLENLDDVFAQIRLSIAPLRFGAGLKGKVATSLGYGVPTIGTSIAFEGMPTEGLAEIKFCADTAIDLAEALVHLHENSDSWKAAALAGMNYVHRHYSIESLTPKIIGLLNASR